tara:strand:- start:607 stop:1788 length:1182 start_codon:yes stop_codon:yes gene_type:complete
VEKELQVERSQLLETLEEGQIVKGIVKNLTDYGAFVNLGGLDGLLHITDIAWKRVKHPSEVLEVGQEIDVRVLKFDRERNRVSLGVKQLGEDPWSDISRRYPEKARLFGKVTNITDYGAFVELEEGVEGLVHVSEMDWTNKNVHPGKICDLGDEVEVLVLDIDTDRRRISLGMKQCVANPWDEFAASYSKGDRISGKIKSITDFGVFIGLAGDIDGLIHLSDLSWENSAEDAVRQYKKGDEIAAVVLAIDSERERISLGVKQAEQDPFIAYVANNPKGSSVKGTVSGVDDKGVTIDLGETIDGYIRSTELSSDFSREREFGLQPGDQLESKIISIERKSRKIYLSVKALENELEGQVLQEYAPKPGTAATTTLADKLKEQLSMQDEVDGDESD